MRADRGRRFAIEPGSDLAVTHAAAMTAFERGDVGETDRLYERLVGLARPRSDGCWMEFADEHVSRLRQLGDGAGALARCAAYAEPPTVRMLALLAETRLHHGTDRAAGLEHDLAAIRGLRLRSLVQRMVGSRSAPSTRDRALVRRLEGLAAARRGDRAAGRRHLLAARELYRRAGEDGGADVVDGDLAALDGPPPVRDERVARARRHRRACRFDTALGELLPLGPLPADPTTRFALLEETVLLLRVLERDEEAEELLAELRRAAARSDDPDRAHWRLALLDPATAPDPRIPVPPELVPAAVRLLVRRKDLTGARRVLVRSPAPEEPTAAYRAERNLAEGELILARSRTDPPTAVPQDAVDSFRRCLVDAVGDPLLLIRRDGWLMLGRALHGAGRLDEAVVAGQGAEDVDRELARRQGSDGARIQLRRGAADTVDERVRAARLAVRGDDDAAAAAVVVALENGRGRQILGRVMGDRTAPDPSLPSHGDVDAALRWVRTVAASLPPSQMIWVMHAGPDHTYHAILGADVLYTVTVACRRPELVDAIERLRLSWVDRNTLKSTLRGRGEDGATVFGRRRHDVAKLLGLAADDPAAAPRLAVLGTIVPSHVTRIAVVAGDDLSDVPFAAMPWPAPGPDTTVGRRFALSELPCLSVRVPLQQRAARQRGGQALLVRPHPASPDDPAALPGRTVLAERRATKEALRRHASGARIVRLDAHGRRERSGRPGVLELAPAGAAGELTPEELESMDLDGCGTLILGACESGMARRRGRDERTGFVRSAFLAGASSVVAARWEVPDPIAERMLDAFERYLRDGHPRDVALHRAALDEDAGVWDTDRERAAQAGEFRYAVWSAAWTLYGDSGPQLGAGRGPTPGRDGDDG